MHRYPLLILAVIVSVVSVGVMGATVTFDNTTTVCGEVDRPCVFSEDSIWVDGKAPTPSDDAVVHAEGVFHFAVANESVVVRTLRFASLGDLVVSGTGEISTTGFEGDWGIYINASVHVQGLIRANGSLVFQGLFNVSGGANIQVDGAWTDVDSDLANVQRSEVILRDTAEVNVGSLRLSHMTDIMMYGNSELWIQGTNNYVHNLHAQDSATVEVIHSPSDTDRDNITFNGDTSFSDDTRLTGDQIILNGSFWIISKMYISDLVYTMDADVEIMGGDVTIESIYPIQGQDITEQIVFEVESSHVKISGAPAGVANMLTFNLNNADFTINNVDLTYAHVFARNSTITGFSGVGTPLLLEMDPSSVLVGGPSDDVTFNYNVDVQGTLRFSRSVTVNSGANVRFGACDWTYGASLFVDDAKLICLSVIDETASTFEEVHISNDGALNIGDHTVFIGQLEVMNSSLIVGGVQVQNAIVLVSNKTNKFEFQGFLTVQNKLDVNYTSEQLDATVGVTKKMDLSNAKVFVSVDASGIHLAEGEKQEFAIFNAGGIIVEKDKLGLEVTGADKELTHDIYESENKVYVRFTHPYNTDAREKKVLTWVWIIAIILSAVALLLAFVVSRKQKREQSYAPIHLNPVLG